MGRSDANGLPRPCIDAPPPSPSDQMEWPVLGSLAFNVQAKSCAQCKTKIILRYGQTASLLPSDHSVAPVIASSTSKPPPIGRPTMTTGRLSPATAAHESSLIQSFFPSPGLRASTEPSAVTTMTLGNTVAVSGSFPARTVHGGAGF